MYAHSLVELGWALATAFAVGAGWGLAHWALGQVLK